MCHKLFAYFAILLMVKSLAAQEINLGDERKIQSLIAKFKDTDPFENGKAIAEISEMRERAIQYLSSSLQDQQENVRWCSAIALEKIAPSGKQAIPYLARALKDSSANVRWCAALALAKFKEDARSSTAELFKLLYDGDGDVRWAAYQALASIDSQAIHPAPALAETIFKIEHAVPLLLKEFKVPGISICLIKNNAVAWNNCYGISDFIQQRQVDSLTAFEACSMSKPVFAYLVLTLVDQGKMELDKPLYTYLPEDFISAEPDYAKQITARMALAHTSGLPNWRKGGEERFGPLPILFQPGLKFSYSGEGIYYLQRVVEKITKEPLQYYARRTLFDDLGLTSTSYVWTEKLEKQIATGYDTSGTPLEKGRYRFANAAYTLYTTPSEYAKMMIAILGPAYQDKGHLSVKMKREMLTHQVRVDSREVIDRPGRHLGLVAYRGLGWAIDATITHDIVYHSGANQTGFRCYAQYNPADGSGIVIMTNGSNGSDVWHRLIGDMGDL
jgi:CubicO group peptidase (beta-lactamase class C family)